MKKVKIKYNHWYPRTFGIGGITLYPYILLSYHSGSAPTHVIKHEMIHVEQIRNIGLIPFYKQYMKELSKGLIKFKNYHKAYFSISFEKEAYARQFEPFTDAEKEELSNEKNYFI